MEFQSKKNCCLRYIESIFDVLFCSVHDAEESAEFYKGLGIQGKELGYEMIPVAIR